MKKLSVVIVLLSTSFGYAERNCFDSIPEEEKNIIYTAYGIHSSIPFYEVCLDFRRNFKISDYLTVHTPEEKFEQAIIVKAGCSVWCVGAGLLWMATPSDDEIESQVREQKPYHEVRGKTIEYRPGGGNMDSYYIGNRDDYERMIANIRAGHKYDDITAGSASFACGCAVTVFF